PNRHDRSFAGYGHEQIALAVVVEERRRLPTVDFQSVPHGGFAVVVALVELATACIADARALRRIRRHVIRVAARAAYAASRQPAQKLGLEIGRASCRERVSVCGGGGARI